MHDALMEMGAKVVLDTVEGMIEQSLEIRVQKSFIQGSEILHKAPKITKELCHVDWDDTSKHIVNLIRGLSDYPCAYTGLTDAAGKVTGLKIFKAAKLAEGEISYDAKLAPGSIISDGKSYFAVKTSDGAVKLLDIQLAGKKRMDVTDFLRGYHNIQDCTLDKGSSREFIRRVHESETTE